MNDYNEIEIKQAAQLFGNKANKSILVCPEHGQYEGWVMTVDGIVIPSQCDQCAKAEMMAERKKREEEIAERMRNGAIEYVRQKSCIPPKFANKDFKSWEPQSERAMEIKRNLADYIVNFNDYKKQGTSFLFLGNSGTGKTHLATAIANNVIRKGGTAIYVSTLHFISKMKAAWNPSSETSEDAIIEELSSFDLLILDELGKGVYDAKEKGMIFRLIDRRYEDCKPTIGISNLSEEKLSYCIDNDAIRRLKTGGGRIIKFDWKPFE